MKPATVQGVNWNTAAQRGYAEKTLAARERAKYADKSPNKNFFFLIAVPARMLLIEAGTAVLHKKTSVIKHRRYINDLFLKKAKYSFVSDYLIL